MIQINNTKIEFNYMGLFTTKDEWIHPEACEKTFEIIFVTDGTVFIEEEKNQYELRKGDLIVLKPQTVHKGYKTSTGKTSFYWIHFNMNRESETVIKRDFSNASVIKELMHYSNMPSCEQYIKDSILMHLLCVISEDISEKTPSALACDIFEWTRINAQNGLTVKAVAEHFGYNCEYISRLIKKQYGTTLKNLIGRFITEKAKNYLNNTKYSVKEISNILGFPSPNTFINFYKYHEKISPNKYRNLYSYTHMNKR